MKITIRVNTAYDFSSANFDGDCDIATSAVNCNNLIKQAVEKQYPQSEVEVIDIGTYQRKQIDFNDVPSDFDEYKETENIEDLMRDLDYSDCFV
jgi:hypothetical protein